MKGCLYLLIWLSMAATSLPESFSTNIFSEIARYFTNENIIISPASIRSCLGLIYMGAKGKTGEELLRILELRGKSRDEVGKEFRAEIDKAKRSHIVFRTVNRLYVSDKYRISLDYRKCIRKFFYAEAENLDFEDDRVPAYINKWVEAQTNHKITDLMAPNSLADATAVLVNAIYFKANWRTPFNKTQHKKDFYVSSEKVVSVPMLELKSKLNHAYFPDLNARAFEIPYDKTDIRMLLIIPRKIDGLQEMETKMRDFNWTTLQFKQKLQVHFFMPEFKVDFRISLKNILKAIGLKLIFEPDGDLGGLWEEQQNFLLDDINHKSYIEIDSKGTKAAASSAVNLGRSLSSFIVDHPFFFAIKDDEKFYFAGHITK